jgi:hypothetical protein
VKNGSYSPRAETRSKGEEAQLREGLKKSSRFDVKGTGERNDI